MTVLIFPSNIEASLDLLAEARRWGQRVIGASSVIADPQASLFDSWAWLPYIDDQRFIEALKRLVDQEQVIGILTIHEPSYLFFSKYLSSYLPQVQLLGENPYERHIHWVDSVFWQSQEVSKRVLASIAEDKQLDLNLIASLIAQSNKIFGNCSNEKIIALCAALISAPKGDVVEIGSFFGKSAYVLNRLAALNSIGATIAVDPWQLDGAVQHDSPEIIQELAALWNWEKVFRGFLLTMMSCSTPPFNYIRASSKQAWEIYSRGESVFSKEFGTTPLAGYISVLHIDGNHDEQDVRQDFNLWSRRLRPDGWVIFDDYEWSHGDGPRLVADEALVTYGNHVERKFIAGGALFIKLKE